MGCLPLFWGLILVTITVHAQSYASTTSPTASPTAAVTQAVTKSPTAAPSAAPTAASQVFQPTRASVGEFCYDVRAAPVGFDMEGYSLPHDKETKELFAATGDSDAVSLAVYVTPWGAWEPTDFTMCNTDGTRSRSTRTRHRNETLHSAFVPGIRYGFMEDVSHAAELHNTSRPYVFAMGFEALDATDEVTPRFERKRESILIRSDLQPSGLPNAHGVDIGRLGHATRGTIEFAFRLLLGNQSRGDAPPGVRNTFVDNNTNLVTVAGGMHVCLHDTLGLVAVDRECILAGGCGGTGNTIELANHLNCRWGFDPVASEGSSTSVASPELNFRRARLGTVSLDTRVLHQSDTMNYGSTVAVIGADMKPQTLRVSRSVFVQVNGLARRRSGTVANPVSWRTGNGSSFTEHCQLSSPFYDNSVFDKDLGFSAAPTMKAKKAGRHVILQSLPSDVLGAEAPYWRNWSMTACGGINGGNNEANAQSVAGVNVAFGETPMWAETQAVCFAQVSDAMGLAVDGRWSRFALSTPAYSVAFAVSVNNTGGVVLGDMASSNPQILLDGSSMSLFRVEHDTLTGRLVFWVGVHRVASRDCVEATVRSVLRVWRIDDLPQVDIAALSPTRLLVRAFPLSAHNTSSELPLPCVDDPSPMPVVTVCGATLATVACLQDSTVEPALGSGTSGQADVTPLLQRQSFFGNLSYITLWGRAIYTSDVVTWISGISGSYYIRALDSNKQLRVAPEVAGSPASPTIEREVKDKTGKHAWSLDCRPELLIGSGEFDAVEWGNRYGGVRCSARSVEKEGKEIDFIPIFQCHQDKCPSSNIDGRQPEAARPYYCTDGNCYARPEECEQRGMWYNTTRPGHEVWRHWLSDTTWPNLTHRPSPRPGHVSAADWFVYPFSGSSNESTSLALNRLLVRCRDAGVIECMGNEVGCVTASASSWANTWEKHSMSGGDPAREFTCAEFHTEFPPATTDEQFDMCTHLGCYPWGEHASSMLSGHADSAAGVIDDEAMCAEACLAEGGSNEFGSFTWVTPHIGNGVCYCYRQLSLAGWSMQTTAPYPLSVTGIRRDTPLWHTQAVCSDLEDVMNTKGVRTNTKVTMLFNAVDSFMDKVYQDGLLFVMKVPDTMSYDSSEAQLRADIDASLPSPALLYSAASAPGWTVSLTVDTSQDHTKTPFMLASEQAEATMDFGQLAHGNGCYEFRMHNPTTQTYDTYDRRLCNNGQELNAGDPFAYCSPDTGGTFMCPASAPVKCNDTEVIPLQYGRLSDRIEISYLPTPQTSHPHILSFGASQENVDITVIPDATVLGIRLNTFLVKVTFSEEVFATVRRMVFAGIPGNNSLTNEIIHMDTRDVFLRSSDEHNYRTLYFMQDTGADPALFRHDMEYASLPWRRVWPDPRFINEHVFLLLYPSTTPMVVYRCVDTSELSFRIDSWLVLFLTMESFLQQEHANCNAFAMRIPLRFGVTQPPEDSWVGLGSANTPVADKWVTPFPVSFDWVCVTTPLECRESYHSSSIMPCSAMTTLQLQMAKDQLGLDYLEAQIGQTQHVSFNGAVDTESSASTAEELGTAETLGAKCLHLDHPIRTGEADWTLQTWQSSEVAEALASPPEIQTIGNHTICMWVLPRTYNANVFLYHKNFAGEGAILVTADGVVKYSYGYGAAPNAINYQTPNKYQNFTLPVALPRGHSTHITIVRDMLHMMLHWFVNGTLVSSAQAQFPEIVPSGHALTIGSSPAGVLLGPETKFDGEIAHLHVYNRILNNADILALVANKTRYPLEGLYRMQRGGQGDFRFVIVNRSGGSDTVEWNNCGISPLVETLCEAGTWVEGSSAYPGRVSLAFGDTLAEPERHAFVDPSGNLVLPSIDGNQVLERLPALRMANCDNTLPMTSFVCDVACGQCGSNCNTPGSAFRIKLFASSETGFSPSQCITLGQNGLYQAPCRDSPQGYETQLVEFDKMDFSAGTAQLRFVYNHAACLYVRDFHSFNYLSVDYSCSLWARVRFLREGVLVDSDSGNAYARATMDTLYPVTTNVHQANSGVTGIPPHVGWMATVSYSTGKEIAVATGQQLPSRFGIPETHYTPRVRIGASNIPEDRANTFSNDNSKYGQVAFSFAAHRIPYSNQTAMVPLEGSVLKGRNWDLVEGRASPLSMAPAAHWVALAATDDSTASVSSASHTAIRLSGYTQRASFHTETEALCKRMCELQSSCAAITWERTNASCSHSQQRLFSKQFQASATFRLQRDKTLSEVIQDMQSQPFLPGSLADRLYTGPINPSTNQPSQALQSLIAQPLHKTDPEFDGVDADGRTFEGMCLSPDHFYHPEASQQSTSILITSQTGLGQSWGTYSLGIEMAKPLLPWEGSAAACDSDYCRQCYIKYCESVAFSKTTICGNSRCRRSQHSNACKAAYISARNDTPNSTVVVATTQCLATASLAASNLVSETCTALLANTSLATKLVRLPLECIRVLETGHTYHLYVSNGALRYTLFFVRFYVCYSTQAPPLVTGFGFTDNWQEVAPDGIGLPSGWHPLVPNSHTAHMGEHMRLEGNTVEIAGCADFCSAASACFGVSYKPANGHCILWVVSTTNLTMPNDGFTATLAPQNTTTFAILEKNSSEAESWRTLHKPEVSTTVAFRAANSTQADYTVFWINTDSERAWRLDSLSALWHSKAPSGMPWIGQAERAVPSHNGNLDYVAHFNKMHSTDTRWLVVDDFTDSQSDRRLMPNFPSGFQARDLVNGVSPPVYDDAPQIHTPALHPNEDLPLRNPRVVAEFGIGVDTIYEAGSDDIPLTHQHEILVAHN